MWQIYHNSRCSKSRAALEYLDQKNIQYEVIYYLETPLTRDILETLSQKLGLPLEEFIRPNEECFKAIAKEWMNYSLDEKVAFVIEHPIVLQRPIVVHDDRAVIARPEVSQIDCILL